MKKIMLRSIAYVIFCNSLLVSQAYEATIQQSINGTFPGSTLDVSLYLEHTGTISPVLGECSFYINFNDPALGTPTLQSDGEWDGDNHSGYSNNFINLGSGVVSIEVVTSGTPTFQIPNSPTLIGTIRFSIDVANQNSMVSWNNTLTEVYDVNSSNIKSNGTFQNPDDVPLPVELFSFTASTNQSGVNLKWQTKTELNNYGFEVERASSKTSPIQGWAKIGFVSGNGNSNSPKDYSFTDNNPYGGSKFIYRLKQIDNNGKFDYSKEVEVELVPNEFALYQNYPNPFNPATNIKFSLPKATRINLSVYNLLGEKIATLLNEDKEAGFYNVQFDASRLSSGVYIYRLTTGDFIKTMKMNLIK